MKSNNRYVKKKDKKNKKRTLKKRIFKVISFSNFSIILILGIAIFFGAIAFLKGSAITMSYFISSNIVKEMSSDFFLEQMAVDSLEELKPRSKEFKYWVNNIDKTLSLDFSTQVQQHIGPGPNIRNRGKKIIDELEEFKDAQEEIIMDLEDDNFVDFNIHYAITSIRIKDRILYETGKGIEENIENYINNLPEWDWLRNQISETIVEVPIYDENYEEIGVVTTCLNHKLLTGAIIVLLTGIVFIGAIAFIISKIVTRIFAMPVLNPLTELQDKMDEIALEDIGEDFGKPITFKKPFYEIERLTDSTNTIMCKMKNYNELLQEQRDEMEAQRDELEAQRDELESQKEELEILTAKIGATNNDLEQKNNQLENIFNNVSQGFLTFGSDLKVRQEYSFECRKIFSRDIGNTYFPELLFDDDAEQMDFLDDILKKIIAEENVTKVGLYIPLLPTEIMINDRYIHISYKVVKDILASSRKSFMLILTDITEKKALEKQRNDERSLLRMIVKIISNQEEFLELVEDFKIFIKSVEHCTLMDEDCFEECYAELFRQIHTFKGSFSQFDMRDMINELHDIESSLTKEKKRLENDGIDGVKNLISTKNFEKILMESLHIFEEYLGKDFFDQKDIIKIKKQKIIEIEDKIVSMLPIYEQKQLLSDVRRLRYKSLKDLLKSYTEYVLKLSERMGKEIKPFEVSGEDVLVDPDFYYEFIKSLVHVFRNSVDHGIEEPEERFLSQKSEIGAIECQVEKENNNILITISDDGQGIDLDKIRRKLVQNKIYSSEEIQNLDKDKLLESIFLDSFSTGEEATKVSGRGVGLSVVKNELSKIKGDLEVITEKSKGTSFKFKLPIKHEEVSKSLDVGMILNSLSETASRYIKEQASIGLKPVRNEYKPVEKINLNKITVLINIKGAFNAIFALSINEPLAKQLVKGFVMDELTPKEVAECIDDVVAESTNIILGNSIRAFDDMEHIVNIGSPTILCYKGASIKNIDSNMVTTQLVNGEYKLGLSIISMDNKIIEEVKTAVKNRTK